MQLNLNQFHSMVCFSGCSVNSVIHKLHACCSCGESDICSRFVEAKGYIDKDSYTK
jgi:hypothetical protein